MSKEQNPWMPDILGPDFECRSLPLPPSSGDETTDTATLVRYRPSAGTGTAQPAPTRTSTTALLWVHGMTDYFFQRHVAEHFSRLGYDFYALDLRKCGRSRKEGQPWHYVPDMGYYFADLDAAMQEIEAEKVVPIGHSTGGLIVSLWLDYLRRSDSPHHGRVPTAILNSPWLDMMSVPRPVLKVAAPAVKALGKRFPMIPFPGGGLTAFGESIHSSKHGEWDFDLNLKPLGGHRKYLGWLRAIFNAFEVIHSGKVDVGRPMLTLCSTKSVLGKPYSEQTNTADAIVDVKQTQKWAPRLGKDSAVHPLLGARHDVFLSLRPAREEAFCVSEQWLAQHAPAQPQ